MNKNKKFLKFYLEFFPTVKMNPSSLPLVPYSQVEKEQSMVVQSHNLDIVPLSTTQISNHSNMEIETVFGNMLRQVSLIGDMCWNSFQEARAKLQDLEDKSNIVEKALETPVNKDQELTVIIQNQSDFNQCVSNAINWLKLTMENCTQSNQAMITKSNGWEKRIDEDIKHLQLLNKDQCTRVDELRGMGVKVELMNDQLRKISSSIETNNGLMNSTLTQMNSMSMRLRSLEELVQKQETRMTKIEDKASINEGKILDNQKALEEQPKQRELINSNTRDILVIDEEIAKLNKSSRLLEEKIDKNNARKLSKKDSTLLDNMESEMISCQERVRSLELVVEHLNEVRFEDFTKRFKNEILENQIVTYSN